MFQLLAPYAKEFIGVQPRNERALPLASLHHVLEQYCPCVYTLSSVEEGIKLSMQHAREEDVICVVGSLYMAGEIRSYFKNK